MEKYYSSVLSSSGLLCNFKILCEKHPESTLYIISDGTDFERAIFFGELKRLFNGYSAEVYSPFYDDAVNGIYLKSLNTYILTDSVYSRASPPLPYMCEEIIHLSAHIRIPPEDKNQLIKYSSDERSYYKKAVSLLSLAGVCNENKCSLLSDYILDDRMINAIKRVIKKIPLNVKLGKPSVKFLSAVTPLGIHTLWDTVFDNFETVIELEDELSFTSAVIAGVVREKLISENEEFTFIPDLFHRTIPQMLLLPQSGTALIRTNENYPIPFSPTYRINTEKFVSLPKPVKEKCRLLTEAENKYTENAVSCVYEGADARQKLNKMLFPYSDAAYTKEKAKELFLKITK